LFICAAFSCVFFSAQNIFVYKARLAEADARSFYNAERSGRGRFDARENCEIFNPPEDECEDECAKSLQSVQKGSGAIVIEQSTRRILFAENKDQKLFPASTTKILTALVAIENLPLDAPVKIPKQAVGIEGSSIYLREGETLTVKELLLGLMLRSGNDSAVALALAVRPTIEEFCALMNERAKLAGAQNSNFKNPHGLHDDEHYTTAFDLALITADAFKHASFREIVKTKSAVLSGVEEKRYIQNKNKILWRYEGANGVKTGYTKMSGRCLVASAERAGMQIISVVLNRGAMWEDTMINMNYAFAAYKMAPLYENLTTKISVQNGKTAQFTAKAEDAPRFPVRSDGSEKIDVEFLTGRAKAPVKTGKECGEVKVYLENRLLFSGKLYSMENVEKKTLRDKIDEFFKRKESSS
jgi:D-alanyl-D-alanine carboxypeptidase (penicillin-binding protein 5/6)